MHCAEEISLGSQDKHGFRHSGLKKHLATHPPINSHFKHWPKTTENSTKFQEDTCNEAQDSTQDPDPEMVPYLSLKALIFSESHKALLSSRLANNIKRARANVGPEVMKKYFENLEVTVANVKSENIHNYDETNLSEDPGRKKDKRTFRLGENCEQNSKIICVSKIINWDKNSPFAALIDIPTKTGENHPNFKKTLRKCVRNVAKT
uniref:Uncharacterized protein n=1 Tax=Romanomermis culicivorax TaxID=13658 RepID=A0A915HFS2_ROMCU